MPKIVDSGKDAIKQLAQQAEAIADHYQQDTEWRSQIIRESAIKLSDR
ncbi:hypothetical protein JOY44_12780 [Phormidium sp. CLA17]|nr:hypothetical protein [Leptolyngbya sp. Cla-17]MBM0742480.1 hypothetical protein [Leptolyngbya sp. Cla-17]